ncbi:hypothetical protein VTP01DRAFT_8456 [Rhizomucor pusillus]|uniref:uncharacterized protein n=1 Tax=Rhizomucor pusillus TaxID=4840 RepID=UPI00374302AF
MSVASPEQQSFELADSPLSPLSSPSSPTFADGFPSSSAYDQLTRPTVYNVLHSTDNPPKYTEKHNHLVTAGCSHLEQYKKQRQQLLSELDSVLLDDDDRCDLFANYQALVRYSLTWQKSKRQSNFPQNGKKRKHKQLPLPQCTTCSDPLSRLHVCLHCVYMGCWQKGHMRQHMKEKQHHFAMDFGRRTLYCNQCGDYVYDAELCDRILRQEWLMSETKGARRKKPRTAASSWEPSSQEITTIINNSVVASCQGIRGLCNMGNTCFMNVILQSFIHNPLLKAYFLSDQHNQLRCQIKHCLCCEMCNLFTEFYSGRKEPYGPCSFLYTMWMSVKELAGYAQQDAHEFFISALNNIHTGCEGHTMNDCKCVIHKTFAGLLQSNVTCLRCGNVTTTVDPMLDISLDLRPSEKKKKVTPLQSTGNASTLNAWSKTEKDGQEFSAANSARRSKGNTLMDCLDRYTQPEKLGPNVYSCGKCGNTFQEATKQLSIKRLPPVLSFQLKRFEHRASASKIETKIKFPVDLDMTPYTAQYKEKKKDVSQRDVSNLYTLFAVINHQGKMDTGHYTMYTKSRDEWFRFDDHNVTMAFQKDVLDSRAYMCFYIKKSLDYEASLEDDIFGFK